MSRQAPKPQGLLNRLSWSLRGESGPAVLLVVVTAIALVWANSPASGMYFDLWHQDVGFDFGPMGLHMSLRHWINDGLMVVFFFLIGLEVRQEFAHGSLRDRTRARLALIAGVSGVFVPAVIYAMIVRGGDGLQGWGVVVGTDTAFMLGALALVGPRLSGQLRVFLLTVTVVDDFLAVSIIGFFYSENIRLVPLVLCLACLLALWALGRARQWRAAPYIVVVVALWFSAVASGVHPSLAGMVAGLLVPAYPTQRHKVVAARELFRDFWQSPSAASGRAVSRGLAKGTAVNERIHEFLRVPTAVLVVPIFALANAGVDVRGGLLADALGAPVTWGVMLGLVLGKFLGIGIATYLAVRMGMGRLPQGVGMGSVMGGAALSGIGFTVSLLIIDLAFGTSDLGRQATVGVLLSMVGATLLGSAVFRVAATKLGEVTADLPMTLEPPVDPEIDHIRGPEDAQLTLVEFLDFECAFCAHATGGWEDLHAHFGGDLRYVVRHLPLVDVHPHALLAAQAAEAAARQQMFWEWLDFVFTRQSALERDDLIRYAVEMGLDVDQFIEDLDSDEVVQRVQRDVASAHASGARETPTFFVEGCRNVGSYDARTLTRELEHSRRGARTQYPHGQPRDDEQPAGQGPG